ncbi:MAG: V-type ATPase subunit [Clostridia bacterium]|nr:V-type ATPase subunit [Clostridia bacterium]
MPNSYEYSFGSVRAREKYLFSHGDIEAMLSLDSSEALVGFLKDKGYGDGDTVEEIIRSNRAQTMDYLKSVVPDMSVFDVFLYPADAHNIKSVIKGLLSNSDYKKLFISPCTIDTAVIEEAVKENEYGLLPEPFSSAAKKAYETLAHTTDARKADAFLDRACMTAQTEKTKQLKNAFLEKYFQTEIFYRNVKTALRACLTSSPEEYYRDALVEGIDGFDREKVISEALKGVNELTDYFSTIKEYRCKEAVEKFLSSPAEFEKFTENLLVKMARDNCKRCGSGPEAALGFYIARLAEEKAVHIIAAGIDAKANPVLTRERLREIYA